jgi:hypothetical protein
MSWDCSKKQGVTNRPLLQYYPLAIAEFRKEYNMGTCDWVVVDASGSPE